MVRFSIPLQFFVLNKIWVGYKYNPDYPGQVVDQVYLPNGLEDMDFFRK